MGQMIRVLSHGLTIPAEKDENLADKLRQAGIPLNLYCNKRGLCGKCFVEIISGLRPEPGTRELHWIRERALSDAHRLSCQYTIDDDLEINVPVASTHEDIPILPSIPESAVSPDPAVRKYQLRLERPEIRSPDSLSEQLLAGLRAPDLKVHPDLLRDLNRTLERAGFAATVVVYGEKEVIAVEPGTAPGQNYGLAIDVGTTTLVMELVDVDSGKTLDLEAALNSQSQRGADVVSRISYALAGADSADELRGLILDSLNQMIRRLLLRRRAAPTSVYQAVIAGNTTMNHLLLGVPLDTLARAPYHAVFSRLPDLEAEDIGLAIHPRGKVYFAPNIKSFVGGDVSSGLLASGLASRPGNSVFIDLGTNGEIVFNAGEELIATSTAAGPAFEGMNISCGMPALPGAIFRAESAGRLQVFTIGNTPPRGVCGTGLIDLMAVFLARGEIAPGGAIRNREKKLVVAEGIVLTQDDVRQMQLACAAVKSGLQLMLKGGGLTPDQLDGIYIAGAFGNYLNLRNAAAIGLLPAVDDAKIVFVGNSSLAGARRLLVAGKERKRIESLVRRIRYVSLASDPEFQDHFIRALEFRKWR